MHHFSLRQLIHSGGGGGGLGGREGLLVGLHLFLCPPLKLSKYSHKRKHSMAPWRQKRLSYSLCTQYHFHHTIFYFIYILLSFPVNIINDSHFTCVNECYDYLFQRISLLLFRQYPLNVDFLNTCFNIFRIHPIILCDFLLSQKRY